MRAGHVGAQIETTSKDAIATRVIAGEALGTLGFASDDPRWLSYDGRVGLLGTRPPLAESLSCSCSESWQDEVEEHEKAPAADEAGESATGDVLKVATWLSSKVPVPGHGQRAAGRHRICTVDGGLAGNGVHAIGRRYAIRETGRVDWHLRRTFVICVKICFASRHDADDGTYRVWVVWVT